MSSPTGSIGGTRRRSIVSACLVSAALLLVVHAYLPTLRHEYVTQDQWRAFRYSVEPRSSLDRARACARTTAGFYLQTGRPLVWITECLEHAAVASISDFARLRPLVLAIVLATVLFLGQTLAPLVGGRVPGTLAAAAFVTVPGYSFMYFQGMTAAMVLITVILSAASFRRLRRMLADDSRAPRLTGLAAPFILFVAACLIYPAWAFVVLPLALLAFGHDARESLPGASRRLVLTVSFYLLAALCYYFGVTRCASSCLQSIETGPCARSREMAMQVDPGVLRWRALRAFGYFVTVAPLNVPVTPALPMVLLVLFAMDLARRTCGRPAAAMACGCLFVGLGGALLAGAISPWLFSSMGALSTSYVLPWYLFTCGATAQLLTSAAARLRGDRPGDDASLASLVLLVALVAPVAVAQNRLSLRETSVSGSEIRALRSGVGAWLDARGWENRRHLVIVLPTRSRPAWLEQELAGCRVAGENAVLSCSRNPVSLPWMVIAVLRERHDHPVGRSVTFADCGFDFAAARRTIAADRTVALTLTYARSRALHAQDPFVIDLSTLTSQRATPRIE